MSVNSRETDGSIDATGNAERRENLAGEAVAGSAAGVNASKPPILPVMGGLGEAKMFAYRCSAHGTVSVARVDEVNSLGLEGTDEVPSTFRHYCGAYPDSDGMQF
jgi:hypothetical protein